MHRAHAALQTASAARAPRTAPRAGGPARQRSWDPAPAVQRSPLRLWPPLLRRVPPQVVGFVPTGWLYEMKRQLFSVREKGGCAVHLVPYSEHSRCGGLLGVGVAAAGTCIARRARPGRRHDRLPPQQDAHGWGTGSGRSNFCSFPFFLSSLPRSYTELLEYVRFLRPHQVRSFFPAPWASRCSSCCHAATCAAQTRTRACAAPLAELVAG